MTEMTETIEVEIDAAVLAQARELGVDINAAVEAGLRDALRQARTLKDLEEIAESHDGGRHG